MREGSTDWTGPGLPSFTLVESPRDADIQNSPTVDSKQFGVDRILVTAREKEPALDVIYGTLLHEVGHALGLAGHSPDPNDVMGIGARLSTSLTERDRATLRALYARPNGHRVTGPKRAD